MKKTFLLFCFLFTVLAFSQETITIEDNDNTIYEFSQVEKQPEFPEGMDAFLKYIGKNYRVPDIKGLSGKVFISFVIEKDGSLTNIKVIKDIGSGTGREAIRVLKSCPKWIAGEQDGKKVRVQHKVPIMIQS